MGFCSQFKALFKKNFILWYRNLCGSLCEVLFPVLLGFILVFVRNVVTNDVIAAKSYVNDCSHAYYFDDSTTTAAASSASWLGLCSAAPFTACIKLNRKVIGVVADNTVYNLLEAGFLQPTLSSKFRAKA